MPDRAQRPLRRLLTVALVAVALCQAVPAAAEAAPSGPTYRPPVDAPVIDSFRPPAAPYGAGNRGLEYGTTPGTEVRAAADGVVTFAGLVAGSRHVTIRHDDGIRTTTSYLATVDVVVGQHVTQGDVLGTTEGHLHFGARNGDAYFDPSTLFVPEPPRVHLVPFDIPPGAGPSGEGLAIRQLLGFGSALLDASGEAVAWVGEEGIDLAQAALPYAAMFVPAARVAYAIGTTVDVVWSAYELSRRACTPRDQDVAPPTGRRIALLVAGLGSDSGHASVDDLDVDALGYAREDVLRFSYAGGRTPDRTDALSGINATGYARPDTQQDLRVVGARLADLVEDIARAAPGVPIDLLGHSQGGLVTRLGVLELERRHGPGWLDRIGLFATIATPHGGAALASIAGVVDDASPAAGGAVEDALGIDPEAPNMGQLAPGSNVLHELAEHRLPATMRAVAIAARGDLVVPAPRARFDGATAVVVPLVGPRAHGGVTSDPGTTRELALARAGAPPGCTSFSEALADEAVGRLIDGGEAAATDLTWLAGGFVESIDRTIGAAGTVAGGGGPR